MTMGWSEVETQARDIFNIWASGGDLSFAMEAWNHLQTAGLANGDGPVARTQALLNLLALRQICGEFSCAKWEEGTGDEWIDLDVAIDPLALGLLAGPILAGEAHVYSNRDELFFAAVCAAVEAVRPQVAGCLRSAYGGTEGLYQRLSRIATNDEAQDHWDAEANPGDVTAYDFVDRGCFR